MTSVRVRFIPPGGVSPVAGSITFTARHFEGPHREVVEGPDVVLGQPQRYEVDGLTVIEVRPTGSGWYYAVAGRTEQGYSFSTNVLVPPSGEHDFEELERVDPKGGLAYQPDPAWWADLNSIRTLGGIPGQDGADAYEVAVREGFTGTREEWLEALQGPEGPPGPRGPGPDPAVVEDLQADIAAAVTVAHGASDVATSAEAAASAAQSRADDAHTALAGHVSGEFDEVKQQAHRNEQALFEAEELLEDGAQWQPVANLREEWEEITAAEVCYIAGEYRFRGLLLSADSRGRLGDLPSGMPAPSSVRFRTITLTNGGEVMTVTMYIDRNGAIQLGGGYSIANYGLSYASANFAWGQAGIPLDGVTIPR